MSKKGILLINLGTPDSDDPQSVYCYLKEFLNDPRVIDIPGLARWILVNFILVPFRYKKSAAAYHKVWTKTGPPLLVNSKRLQQALANELGGPYQVELGMRYGNPSIKSALEKLKKCNSITVIPLFPQYSSAATGSAIEYIMNLLSKEWNIPELYIKKDFYDNTGFVTTYAEVIKETIAQKKIDHIIFSYHGLPERHIKKSHCQAKCNHRDTCPTIEENNSYCYRAQCYKTSELIAHHLNLTTNQYSVAFQSRLGRTPWIKPYTDQLLPELRKKDIKNIAIVCPSFITDCLETLEEVNIRMRNQWSFLNGDDFIFVPCINDHPLWIQALKEIALYINKI